MSERPDMEGPWHGDDGWSTCHLGGAVKSRFDHIERRGVRIYFLRKEGTTDKYYQRRGGRKCHSGCKRGTRTAIWGPITTAACWTSPNGPRPVKGSDGEIVSFQLGEEIV